MNASPSRRDLLAGVVVAFGWSHLGAQAPAPDIGDLKTFPTLDAWIRLGPDGKVTIFTGKAELGQGVATALVQVAAEELALPADRIAIVTADTARTMDEGLTAGSNSMHDSGTAILNAAANLRVLLVEAAAQRWSLPPDQVVLADGAVTGPGGRRLSALPNWPLGCPCTWRRGLT